MKFYAHGGLIGFELINFFCNFPPVILFYTHVASCLRFYLAPLVSYQAFLV